MLGLILQQESHAAMIIVTGTKRSGTSMWMQILGAAGLQVFGAAFPKNWKDTIEGANPHGFFESPFRRGIYYATNPDPRTGIYIDPRPSASLAVKVFIPGLCRTDLAFVRRVVATVRHWREYASSIERLREMEAASLREKRGPDWEPAPALDPVVEWWLENFALIRDIATRRYPAHVLTYESVLERPAETLPPVLEWLGAPDIDAGVAVVSPKTRTQHRDQLERHHEHDETFDALYDTIATGEPLSGEFLERLNETHLALLPQIEAEFARIATERSSRRRRNAGSLLDPDLLESVVHGNHPADEEE